MATQAAHVLAKGPLSTALGQWAFLGVGTFVLFTGDNGVSRAAQDVAAVALRLVTGRDGGVGRLFREAALGSPAAANGVQQPPQAPIVIHSVSSGDARGGRSGWTATIVQLGLASGACWGAYIIFSNFLPDQIKEMLPVTRKFFEGAITSLGQGVLRVREVLGEQIQLLGAKQDALADKQDETHGEVLGLKDDIGDVRLHIDDIAVAISRCEESLTDAAGRQTYMSRGVRLLVQCVGDLLRPSNPTVAEELDQFSRLSSEMGGDFHYRDNGNTVGGGRGRSEGGGDGTPKPMIECPSSPNLSEIGSMTSMDVGDHHHHPHHHHPRHHSLPRPRRSQPTAPVPRSASKAVGNGTLLGMASPAPGGKLRMLSSFGSSARHLGSDAGTATTASMSTTLSRSHSLNEREEGPRGANYPDSHPSSGHVTPLSDAGSDPVRKEDMMELLRRVERGGISPVMSPAAAY